MNIMVFDVPASSGGALAILNEFYNEVVAHNNKNIKWIFVISTPILKEKTNIKVLNFPWIKKSWLHRLFFDIIVAPKLVKEFKVDKIMSFQNLAIFNSDKPQMIYLHQSLPFSEYKFKLKDGKQIWLYQNIISKLIFKSIRKADKVIVQTNWMKDACIKETGVDKSVIFVQKPQLMTDNIKVFKPSQESLTNFFYPANSSFYKNHRVIVEACKLLKKINLKDFSIIFTLNGDENKNIRRLKTDVDKFDLPIIFVGVLTREEVFNLYSKSILIFPSFIETFGLPMLESRLHKGMILASNCPFSKEILIEYKNAYFFDPHNEKQLASLIGSILNGSINYRKDDNSLITSNKLEERKLIDILIEM